MCPDRESNPQPLVYRVTLQPPEPPSHGPSRIVTLPQRYTSHHVVSCPSERGTWQGPEASLWPAASKKVNPASNHARRELGSHRPPSQPRMRPQPQGQQDLGQVGNTERETGELLSGTGLLGYRNFEMINVCYLNPLSLG